MSEQSWTEAQVRAAYVAAAHPGTVRSEIHPVALWDDLFDALRSAGRGEPPVAHEWVGKFRGGLCLTCRSPEAVPWHKAGLIEAADEIERLRAELAESQFGYGQQIATVARGVRANRALLDRAEKAEAALTELRDQCPTVTCKCGRAIHVNPGRTTTEETP